MRRCCKPCMLLLSRVGSWIGALRRKISPRGRSSCGLDDDRKPKGVELHLVES